MYKKLFLNKLFTCLINEELVSYGNYFLWKKVPKYFFINAFKVMAFCEAVRN